MIQLKQLHFNYPQTNTNIALPDIAVASGEKVAIVGASGAGKSTLLNLIAGFLFPQQGTIHLNGTDHSHSQPYQRPVSMLFQHNNLFNHLTVAQNITLGLQPKLSINATQQQQIEAIATQVGLVDYLQRYPDKLSGGQQQRVALARCMLRDQPILLLDEPFSALDKTLRAEMLALLAQISADKQLTVMMVTHQPEEIEGFVDGTIAVP